MDLKLKDKSEIEGNPWIEFNISGTFNYYEHWAKDSKYVEEYAYNLFTDIFEKNCNSFNYYGSTVFTHIQLERIKKEIKKRNREIAKIKTLEDLISFSNKIDGTVNFVKELQNNFEQFNIDKDRFLNDIKYLAKDIIDLLTKCIGENKTLRILGL